MATFWSIVVYAVVIGLPIFAITAVIYGGTHDH